MKISLFMKCSFLLVFVALLRFTAYASGQPLVSIHLKNVEINQVFSTLEKESGYHFLFNSRLPDIHKVVDLDVDNAEISQVLNNLFTGTTLQYKILENKLIVVSSSDAEQDITISGKVTNENNEPLSGVSITVKGKTTGTTTDANGNFKLSAPENTVLIISYIGYTTQELPASGEMNIKLAPSSKTMDQVVVVGYGTQRKKDITGAVATVGGAEMVKQPVLTATQAIQGKVAGVQIISSGAPGSSPQVRIRGTGTALGGTAVLYVVDGVLTDDITNINTADIVDMSILKDASAAAIYGSRGANGVMIITTKKGAVGQMKINYNGNVGVRTAADLVKMANTAEYDNYYQAATGQIPPATSSSTDWYNTILRNAWEQNHNVSVSGGSDKVLYFFSASYLTDQGILVNNDYKRFTIRSNDEFKISKAVQFGIQSSFSNSNNQNGFNNINIDPNGNIGSAYNDAYRAAPIIPDIVGGKYGNTSAYQNVGNPLLDLSNNSVKVIENRIQGTAYLNIKPVEWLSFRSVLGGDYDNTPARAYNYQFFADDSTFLIAGGNQYNTRSSLQQKNTESFHWVWDNILTFSKTYGEHYVSLMVGTTAEKLTSNWFSATRKDVPADQNLWYIGNGDQNSSQNDGGGDAWARNSYLARLNYAFEDKYLLTGTFRRDGSSRFPEENRWGNFPSVGAGWVISKESFMDNQNIFNYLKLRGSWGEVGNDQIPTDAYTTTVALNLPYAFSGSAGAATNGVQINQIKDPNITWETTQEYDAAIEFSTFNSRLTGEVDYYNKKVQNALIYVNIPSTVGDADGQVLTNAANIQNKGWEVQLTWRDKIKSDISYHIGANATFNTNTVVGLNGGQPLLDAGIGAQQGYITRTDNGHAVGSFYVLQMLGVFQSDADVQSYVNKSGVVIQPGAHAGDLKYQDTNGDGKIDDNDRIFAGAYQPKVYFGLNTGLNYKKWDFSFDIYGNLGNQVYNGKRAIRVAGTDNIESALVYNRWTPVNPTQEQPIANSGNLLASTYFVESGSFIRINNITLGYTFVSPGLEKLKIVSLRVFATAQNLYTWKKYSGFTAELPGSPTNSGIELNAYPTTRTINGGIYLSF
jgi:TonB-dependent starch-binding outer membrane protein SusC